MFLCPRCRQQLTRTQAKDGVLWVCGGCGGRAINLALLRKRLLQEPIRQLWFSALEAKGPQHRACPACRRPMLELPAQAPNRPFVVDVCKRCQFFWFDAAELESLPHAPPRPLTPEEMLPQTAREAMAMWEIRKIAEQHETDFTRTGPDEWWQQVAGWLGLPVELDNPVSRKPWLTWALAACMVLVAFATFGDLENVVRQFGMVPSDPFRLGGLTWLTSFFLHGGVFHLLSNVYFLLVFGDNVEELLGRRRYLALILAAAFAGDVLHVTLDPHSDVPAVGASGGISGVIVFYALQFPHAKLGVMFRYFYYLFRWVTMSAFAALILWLALQIFGAFAQVGGFSRVSSLAHLGGAAVGFGLWLLYRWRQAPGENGKVR